MATFGGATESELRDSKEDGDTQEETQNSLSQMLRGDFNTDTRINED